MDQTLSLPPGISDGIDQFLQQARQAFGSDLLSAVLFGSAAEGRLRPTSDVNLLLVLRTFDRTRVDAIRNPLRAGHAAFHLDVMFLLESEIGQAADAFAVKFADILSRRRVLHGPDPFVNLTITPEAIVRRLQQVLLNHILRMRERYALVSLREEQLALIVADLTGPLRACAASLLKLEGRPAASPREAFSSFLAETGSPAGMDIGPLIDQARSQGVLPAGVGGTLLFSLIEIAERMHQRTTALLKGSGG